MSNNCTGDFFKLKNITSVFQKFFDMNRGIKIKKMAQVNHLTVLITLLLISRLAVKR